MWTPFIHTNMRTLPFSILALCVVACSDDSTSPATPITYPLKAVDAARKWLATAAQDVRT